MKGQFYMAEHNDTIQHFHQRLHSATRQGVHAAYIPPREKLIELIIKEMEYNGYSKTDMEQQLQNLSFAEKIAPSEHQELMGFLMLYEMFDLIQSVFESGQLVDEDDNPLRWVEPLTYGTVRGKPLGASLQLSDRQDQGIIKIPVDLIMLANLLSNSFALGLPCDIITSRQWDSINVDTVGRNLRKNVDGANKFADLMFDYYQHGIPTIDKHRYTLNSKYDNIVYNMQTGFLLFVIAHEYAHLWLNHTEQSIENEQEADSMATDIALTAMELLQKASPDKYDMTELSAGSLLFFIADNLFQMLHNIKNEVENNVVQAQSITHPSTESRAMAFLAVVVPELDNHDGIYRAIAEISEYYQKGFVDRLYNTLHFDNVFKKYNLHLDKSKDFKHGDSIMSDLLAPYLKPFFEDSSGSLLESVSNKGFG